MPPKRPTETPQTEAMAARARDNEEIVTNPPSYLEYSGDRQYQFLIMDTPTDANIDKYIDAMKAKSVRKVIRACEPSYSILPLENCEPPMKVVEMPFSDGSPPSDDIISQWLTICKEESGQKQTVAVHCVAGLGRAPVLVAIALMELAGISCLDAIDRIRRVRRGAINQRQLKYLREYNPRAAGGGCCTIM